MNVGIKDFQTVLEKAREAGVKLQNEVLKCAECKNWCGRCLLGKKNRVANSAACEEFSPR